MASLLAQAFEKVNYEAGASRCVSSSLLQTPPRVGSASVDEHVIKEDVSMNRFCLTIVLFSLVGCTTGAENPAISSRQEAGSGYCHKKLQAVGPTDPGKPAQIGGGDYIDYYGPCDGPSASEQLQTQRRFEQFRFGRDYMDEG